MIFIEIEDFLCKRFLKLFIELSKLSFHDRVPMVFYWVVSSSFNELCKHCPFVAIQFMKKKQNPLFTVTPLVLWDLRVQMIEPSFSALFSLSALNVKSNEGPFVRTMLLNEFCEQKVLFFSPYLFWLSVANAFDNRMIRSTFFYLFFNHWI